MFHISLFLVEVFFTHNYRYFSTWWLILKEVIKRKLEKKRSVFINMYSKAQGYLNLVTMINDNGISLKRYISFISQIAIYVRHTRRVQFWKLTSNVYLYLYQKAPYLSIVIWLKYCLLLFKWNTLLYYFNNLINLSLSFIIYNDVIIIVFLRENSQFVFLSIDIFNIRFLFVRYKSILKYFSIPYFFSIPFWTDFQLLFCINF